MVNNTNYMVDRLSALTRTRRSNAGAVRRKQHNVDVAIFAPFQGGNKENCVLVAKFHTDVVAVERCKHAI